MSEAVDDWEPGELGPLPYVPTVMDADLFPDDVAAWAVSVDPGSAVMTPLAVLNRRRMSRDGLLDALAALDRHVAWGQALQVRYLAELAASPPCPPLWVSETRIGSGKRWPARCGCPSGTPPTSCRSPPS